MKVMHASFVLAGCLCLNSSLHGQTASTSVKAMGGTAVTTGSDWEMHGTHQHRYVLKSHSAFDGGAFLAWISAPTKTKNTAGTNSTTTPAQSDPDGSDATGFSAAEVTSDGGMLVIDYSWVSSFCPQRDPCSPTFPELPSVP